MQIPKTEKVLEASSAPPRFIHYRSITKLQLSTSIFKQKESLAGRGEMTFKIHRIGGKSNVKVRATCTQKFTKSQDFFNNFNKC